jgi:hypothetical protein
MPVPHSAAIKRALNRHLPLAMTEPKTVAMDSYRALAQRVVGAIARSEMIPEAHYVGA